MKKIIFLTILLILITSCENEPVDFYPADNNEYPVDNNDYSVALDTLKYYSDYILGDYGERFLISTDVTDRNYLGSTNYDFAIDSSFVQINLVYRFLDNNIVKSTFVSFARLEPITKLDPLNHNRYINFSDFVDFFNRDSFSYYTNFDLIKNSTELEIYHLNQINIDNSLYGYASSRFEQEMTPNDFNFIVDSINVIEQPIKKVEVYYSFKCIGVNSYKDELIIKNGKGKSTFEY